MQMTRGALRSAVAHILPRVARERETRGRGTHAVSVWRRGRALRGLRRSLGKEWSYPEGFMEEVGLGE